MKINQSNLSFKNMSYGNKPGKIYLHHASASVCDINDIHRWHLNNGWSGCGYHYLVRKDGSVWKGRPDNAIGSHCAGHNTNTLGICFEGNYQTETMGQQQKQSGKELVSYLKGKYGITSVRKHSQDYSTDCPGKNFPFNEIAGASGNVTIDTPQSNTSGQGISVDGYWGKSTTMRLQAIFGTVADGVVSHQFSAYKANNPGLDSGWQWESQPNGNSPLIKKIQLWCGASADGHIGPETIKRIQSKLGCHSDGYFSKASPAVKALQTWCNKQ